MDTRTSRFFAGLAAAVIVPVAIELAISQHEKEKRRKNPPPPEKTKAPRRKLPTGWT